MKVQIKTWSYATTEILAEIKASIAPLGAVITYERDEGADFMPSMPPGMALHFEAPESPELDAILSELRSREGRDRALSVWDDRVQ